MKLALREILAREGVKQAELAERTGFSRGFVSELVANKKSASQETLAKIVAALGISPSELFVDEQQASPAPPPGFSESEAVFVQDQPAGLPDIAGTPTPSELHHAQLFLCTQPKIGFGILTGDNLVVDIKETASNGKIVLATKANHETGEACTLLLRDFGSCLATDNPADPPLAKSTATESIVVLGVVKRVYRATSA